MGVNWGLARPNGVMDAFNAAEDRAHQRNERDYVTGERMKAEGVDAARRKLGQNYGNEPAATPQPAMAPASPIFTMTAPPAAAPAQPLPTGANSAGGDAAQLEELTRGAPPVVAPASKSMATTPSMAAAGTSGAAQFSAAAVPPPAPVVRPAPSNAPAAAAPPVSPSPAAAPPSSAQPSARSSGMGSMIRSLSSTPGTGADVMNLMTADRTDQRAQSAADQRLKIEMEKEVYNHIKNGDWNVAQSISRRYGLGIPDEVFAHRGVQQAMTRGAQEAAKLMGTKGTFEQHMTFANEYAKVIGAGGAPDQAVQQASAAAMKVQSPEATQVSPGHVVADDGSVQAWGKNGVPIRVGTFRARQSARGEGGGSSATERMITRIQDEAEARGRPIPYAEAARLARGGNNDTMARERLAASQAKSDTLNYYRDPAGTLAKWRKNYGLAGSAPVLPEGDDAPAPAPASPSAPPTKVREYVPGKGFR